MGFVNIKYLFLLFFISLYSLGVNGQSGQYRFEHLDVSNGLTQNTVNDIFQGSQGYLWIATQDGLNRYDGYEIRQYVPDRLDSTSISDNFIWNLSEDSFGNLWFCTRNAVNRLDKKTGDFLKFYNDLSVNPTAVTHKGDSTIVLSGNQLYYIPSDLAATSLVDSLEHYSDFLETERPGTFATRIYNGRIAMFSEDGISVLSNSSKSFTPYRLNMGGYVTVDNQVLDLKDGRFLIGTINGLHLFNAHSLTVNSVFKGLHSSAVHAIDIGPRGNLWIATDDGIKIIDMDEEKLVDFSPLGNASDILKSEIIFSIFTDKNDLLWVGSSNNGLFKYDPHLDRFKFLNTSNGLNNEVVWSIVQTNENEYWLGTESGVTVLKIKQDISLTQFTFLPEAIESLKNLRINGIAGNRVNMLYVDHLGNRWVGVHGSGLYILDAKNRVIKRHRFNEGDPVSNQLTSVVFYEDKYWVTTFRGIYLLNSDFHLEEWFEHENLNTQYFFKVFKGSDNLLWLGSNTGFFQYKGDNNELTHFPYKQNAIQSPGFYFVNDFAEGTLGHIWMGTYGGGLDLFDQKNNDFGHFTIDRGLANNVVASLQLDQKGKLWLGTNRGISRFDPSDSSFINFDMRDGLIFNETTINASHQNAAGELFFGTVGGLVVFHPDSIKVSESTMPPKYTGIKVNYQDLDMSLEDGAVIDLYPKDKVVSLEFAALTFRNTDRLIYEFRIDENDDQWGTTSAENRRITYSSLPFGTHTLQVRVRNIDGALSEPSTIQLVVHPPFWYTWWFISFGIILILLVVVYSVKTYYRNQMKSKMREIEVRQRVQTERERISRDLHDNVGSQITHIISSLDNISYQHRDTKDVSNKLESLGDFTRSTLSFLRETIWVINKNAVSLIEFAEKTSEYGQKISDNLPIDIVINRSGENIILNPTVAMNLFRIFQEGVNNAIKHAQATEIRAELIGLNNQIQVTISDNGIGFDGKEKKGHYGLQNMKDRISEIQGKFELRSSDSGTQLKVVVPLRLSTSNA